MPYSRSGYVLGEFYITAATYQGQTRYGRTRVGGVLSGRDPSVLPACSE